MVKRQESTTATNRDMVEPRIVAFAEQLGRVLGTVQAKSEGWLDRDALREQITNVRDSAADLLKQMAGESAAETSGRSTPIQSSAGKSSGAGKSMSSSVAISSGKAVSSGKGRGPVDAPGKRHRKPIPSPVGVKASDTRIAKMKLAKETRRRSHD